MHPNHIFKGEDIPEESIILATKSSLDEIKEIRDQLHSYLNLIICSNSEGRFELRFVYKLLMRIQGGRP